MCKELDRPHVLVGFVDSTEILILIQRIKAVHFYNCEQFLRVLKTNSKLLPTAVFKFPMGTVHLFT